MKKILGISAFYHDSAAALIVGNEIIAAAQEERFTRIKHTPDFPINAIKYCLEESGLRIGELDAVVFYDKPLLKFERLLQTYYAFAPKGLQSFLKAMPVWLDEKMFLKKLIYDGLNEIEECDKKNINLLFSEHHLSHCASAFYPSRFTSSAILTIDGVGEWSTASIAYGNEESIEILKEMEFPHSVGLLYSAFTYFLGFEVNSGEYKLMGLAPYGNAESSNTKNYKDIIKSNLVNIKTDGSIWIDQSFFNYTTGLRMIKEGKWKKLFGFGRRIAESELEQKHCDLALAIQQVVEEIVLKMAVEAKRLTQADNLCLAGGVALNCVANGKLLREKIFKEIYVQPAAGDAGGALGAAFAVQHMYYQSKRITDYSVDNMKGAYLGPEFSDKEIITMNKKVKSVYDKFESFGSLSDYIAEKIADGNVIGWYQGRMEFGPRSLGNRSIIADARNPEMQKRLNLKIKYREGFRPFAPSVLEEKASDYFDIHQQSPYMLFVSDILENRRTELPDDYHEMPLMDKLYEMRSDIQSVTHLDFSARVQTVNKDTNPRFWALIKSVEEKTGYSLVINTSFNVRGEPIVCTPFDAYRCFMSTEMDYLVINNFLYVKTDQPNWNRKDDWKVEFKSD